ncbi:hypothetical protein HPB52_024635 [Rhipicephalus sanguineus]|uniref:Uncharacterized protein n=1 Tax=Rhipicephalus sanguineus TaxID=34632 RepID=A0A9D4TE60_RHISA|nr:hypothetical protein HPB52_024635 [Rhipicephalus sanguineus]
MELHSVAVVARNGRPAILDKPRELREEVSLTIERLQTRVKSVEVSVTTPRSEEQEAHSGNRAIRHQPRASNDL